MKGREAWLEATLVFVVALVVRGVAAAGLRFPVPEDTAYYAGVARNLIEGRGLVTDALWSFGTLPLVVPRAAFEVWLPLPSLIEAVPMTLLGAAEWFRAAQLSSVLVGALVAVLAWRLGADVAAERHLPAGRARTLAVGSGFVAGVLTPLVMYGAMPDSTMPFAALSLAACLLMTRIAQASAASSGISRRRPWRDRRVLALGGLLGLAALTRSEALWLGLAWLVVVWLWVPGSAHDRLLLVVVPAAVAGAIFLPWAVRDWVVFGNPLPGQALANALFVTPYDVFAYQDQPTLSRYLAQGPAALLAMRVTGTAHDLFSVLVLPALPTGPIGLLALPWMARLRTLRPLILVAAITFLVASLVFPVSTTWGTFLHAAGAIHVLLVVSCLAGLDALIARLARIRGWTRPVAWLGPAFAAAVALPLLATAMGTLDRQADDVAARYQALPVALAAAGVGLVQGEPVIIDHPIWLAEATRRPASALPEESPAQVLELARAFGARLVVLQDDGGGLWPGVLGDGSAQASCYRPISLADISSASAPLIDEAQAAALAHTRVFQVVCR